MQPVSLDCHQHMIEIEDLSFSYGEQKVISGLSYTVKERDFLGIIGSNGAGKTTLMKMIVGLLPPSSGDIKLFGQSVRKFKDWERIGYVPQKMLLTRCSRPQCAKSFCPDCTTTRT